MNRSGLIVAEFSVLRNATGALDWFRNQAIASDCLRVFAIPTGGEPRAPQRGDNERIDLKWMVALDVDRTDLSRREVLDTLRREGGTLVSRYPARVASRAPA